jgi:CBS domain-containing protein
MTPVEALAMKNLLTAPPDATVREAVGQMVERKVGAILVVDDGKLAGIFSERDALGRVLAGDLDADGTRLGDVCTKDLLVVRRNSPIKECVELVRRYGIRHIPVVDDENRPVGILSSRDFLSYVINELEHLIEQASVELRREELTDPYSLIGE